ncbi:glycosyl hydrolase family 76-domain-containing protein [Xylaria intraflava]|nr:glycosyl hydrolase family 76-domain-containing protein [Xylaria intraflava]
MARLSSKFAVGTAAAIAFAHATAAIQLDTKDTNSIKSAAGEVVKGLYVFHNEAATTGQFNQIQPWYWWLSGSGWTGIMDYIVYTKDTTHKADLMSALSKNVGPNFDFSPPSQAGWEANDDLAYWLYAALTAMEYEFDTLPGAPTWDVIATNVFNLFVERWNIDIETCNGGLKWQYNPKANGWTYKNAVSNGAFFQTAARLARYTGNQTFADWATKIWDWSASTGLVSDTYHVYDGASDDKGANCSQVNKVEWSYNIATYIHGAAHMYNFTNGDTTWEQRVSGLVGTAASTFFKPAKTGIMFEQNCEPNHSCTTDQTSFKASLSRWLGKTAIIVPSLQSTIVPLLEQSAAGAAQSCVGYGNSTCGLSWTGTGFDGQTDFGVELSALETIQSLLVFGAPAPAIAANRPPPTTTTSKSAPATSTKPASTEMPTTTSSASAVATSDATTIATSVGTTKAESSPATSTQAANTNPPATTVANTAATSIATTFATSVGTGLADSYPTASVGPSTTRRPGCAKKRSARAQARS